MKIIKPNNFLNKSGFSFEDLICKLLYEEYGEIFEHTTYTNDGGKDFESSPILLKNQKTWVECKKLASALSYNDITKTLLMAFVKKVNKVLIFSYSPVNSRFYRNIAEYKYRTKVEVEVYDDEKLEKLLLKYKNKEWFSDYIILDETIHDDINTFLPEITTISCIYSISKKLRKDNNKVFVNMYELFSLDILLINQAGVSQNAKIDYSEFKESSYFELLNAEITRNNYCQEISISPHTSIIIRLYLRTVKYEESYKIPSIRINCKTYRIRKKMYTTWLAQTDLIGDSYKKIKNMTLQNVQSAQKLNFILIEGSTGTGKSNLLLEVFQSAHQYNYKSFYCDIDKKKISIKLFCQEIFAFFTQLPFFKNTKKSITYFNKLKTLSFKLGARILYERNFNYSKNIENIAKCIFWFLQKEKYLLIIDNIQKYDSLSIKLIMELIHLSSNQTCVSTILLSMNIDFLIEGTKVAELNDLLHLLCRRKVTQYHNYLLSGFDDKMAEEYIHKCLNIAHGDRRKYKKIINKIIQSIGCNPLILQNYLIYLYNNSVLNLEKSFFILNNLSKFFETNGSNYIISDYFINELDELLLEKVKKNNLTQSYFDLVGLFTIIKEISRSTIEKISGNCNIIDLLVQHGIIIYSSEANTYLFRHIEIKHYYQQKYQLQRLDIEKILLILNNSVFRKNYIEAIFLLEFEAEEISEADLNFISKEILRLNIDFDNLEKIYTRVLALFFQGLGKNVEFNLKVMNEISDNSTRVLGIDKALIFQEKIENIIRQYPEKYMSFSSSVIEILKEYLRHLMNVRRIHEALDTISQLKDLSSYIDSSTEKSHYINELSKMNILCLYKINSPELALKSVQDLIDNSNSPINLAEYYMLLGNIYYRTSLRYVNSNVIISNWNNSYEMIKNLKVDFHNLSTKKQAVLLNVCIKHILAILLQKTSPNEKELQFLSKLLNCTNMPYFEIKIRHLFILCQLVTRKSYNFLLSPLEYAEECLDILSVDYGNKTLYSITLFFLAEIYKEKKDYSKMYSYFLNFYSIFSSYYFNDGDIDNDNYLLIEMIISLRKYKGDYPQTFNFNIMNNIPSADLYQRVRDIYYMSDQDFKLFYKTMSFISLFNNPKSKSNYPLI